MSTQTITIQRTSKKYKAAGCLGNLTILIGGIWGVAVFMINKDRVSSEMISYSKPAIVFGAGLLIRYAASILAWWNHG